jgi:hypothetical protein
MGSEVQFAQVLSGPFNDQKPLRFFYHWSMEHLPTGQGGEDDYA